MLAREITGDAKREHKARSKVAMEIFEASISPFLCSSLTYWKWESSSNFGTGIMEGWEDGYVCIYIYMVVRVFG